jgi:hypothetical protein
MVDGLIDFEKVNTTWVLSPTLVVPFAGVIVTVGAVWSAVLAVVKLKPSQSLLPASSVNPQSDTFICVLPGYGVDASGVNVTAAPFTL